MFEELGDFFIAYYVLLRDVMHLFYESSVLCLLWWTLLQCPHTDDCQWLPHQAAVVTKVTVKFAAVL